MPFGDVVTAMITPFAADGAVAYDQAWKLAQYLADNGSDSILVSGTTGESPTLTSEEKVALFQGTVEAVAGKAKVIAGTGTYDTAQSVELSKAAADVGCDGLLAVTPYYSKPPQEGLFRHFTAIAESTDLPLMLYNIPGRTARLIEIPTLARLGKNPKIVATKDAVEDTGFTARTVEACGDSLAVYSGSDAYTLPMVAVGARGVVSVPSHLVGPQIKRMLQSAIAGDLGTATKLHHALLPLFDALFVEPNPIPIKGIMNEVWGPVGEPRLPLVAAQLETVALLKETLASAQQV